MNDWFQECVEPNVGILLVAMAISLILAGLVAAIDWFYYGRR